MKIKLITQIIIVSFLNMGILNAQKGVHFSVSPTSSCDSLKVGFTNHNPSNGYTPVPMMTTGFVYEWNFGNGSTSNQENPDSVTYTSPGTYDISYSVSVDTIGFEISKVEITCIDCDDPDIWPTTNDPDIYIQILDGNSTMLLDTESEADNHTTDPSNAYVLYDNLNLRLTNYTPPFLIRVKDKDSADSDDNCIDDSENEFAGTFITLPPNNENGFGQTSQYFVNGGVCITVHFNKPAFVLSESETVEVFPAAYPPIISPYDTSLCPGQSVPPFIASGSDIIWYSDSALTSVIDSTDTLIVNPVNLGTYNYFATQTNGYGCTSDPAMASLTIGQMSPPDVDSVYHYCTGEQFNDIIATGTNIKWYDDTGLTNLIQAGDTMYINQNDTGSYTYYVTQEDTINGCVSSPREVNIEILQGIDANFIVDSTSCHNTADGFAEVTITEGTPPYILNWSDGSSGDSLVNALPQEYTLTIIDNNFCLQVFSVTVPGPEPIYIEPYMDDYICYGDSNGIISLDISGGELPLSYLWSDGSTEEELYGVVPGTYSITVTDNKACTADTSITIEQPTEIVITNSTVNESCNGSYDGTISISVEGGISPYIYNWSEGSSTDTFANNLTAGTYNITVTDFNNCTQTEKIKLESTYNFCLVPANVLTPNGDGANDYWKIKFINMYPDVNVKVFERSGELVFESTGYDKPWKGEYNGRKLPVGSYYYIIDIGQGQKPMTGIVDIIR